MHRRRFPMTYLTPDLWLLFLTNAQAARLHGAGTCLALELLAAPQGLRSPNVRHHPNKVHRLNTWMRKQWVRAEHHGHEANGARRVTYHATPAFHAAIGIPPAIAAVMHKHVKAWTAIVTETAMTQHPVRLLALLISIAVADAEPDGWRLCRFHQRRQPFLAEDVNYTVMLDALVQKNIVRRFPVGQRQHYRLQPLGRRLLALPPVPGVVPMHYAVSPLKRAA